MHRAGIFFMVILYALVMYITDNYFSLVGVQLASEIEHPKMSPGVDQMGWIFLSILMVLCDGSTQFLNKQWEDAVNYKADLRLKMSHELRTPLFSIIGAVDLLKKTKLDSWQFQLVNLVDRFAKTLVGWVSGLLDTSKLMGGQPVDIEKRATHVTGLLDDVVEVIKPMAIAKGIVLVADTTNGAPSTMLTDPMRFHQVIATNLFYAIKLSSPGNVIQLTVSTTVANEKLRMELQLLQKIANPVNVLIIKVEDTGVESSKIKGHPTANLYSGNKPTPSHFRSTKTEIELSMANYLLAKLGGIIRYETGKGTFSFTISIPIGTEGGEAEKTGIRTPDLSGDKPLVPLTKAGERPFRLLIAEDNAINQLLLTKMAEYLHIDVEMAGNGIQVLRKVKEEALDHFDAVLLDLEMPGMGGVECTKMLRKMRFTKPIMIMSSHALDYQKQLLVGVEVQFLLLKPITIQSLHAAVRNVIQSAA